MSQPLAWKEKNQISRCMFLKQESRLMLYINLSPEEIENYQPHINRDLYLYFTYRHATGVLVYTGEEKNTFQSRHFFYSQDVIFSVLQSLSSLRPSALPGQDHIHLLHPIYNIKKLDLIDRHNNNAGKFTIVLEGVSRIGHGKDTKACKTAALGSVSDLRGI